MEKHQDLGYENFSGLKIAEVQAIVKSTTPSEKLLELLRADGRQGLLKLAEQVERQLTAEKDLADRFEAMLEHEHKYLNEGYTCLAGVDEAGRGPLAGPVVAAAVVLGPDFRLFGLNDSKQLKEEERENFYLPIMQEALGVGIGIVDQQEIDQINILQASFKAMRMALAQLAIRGLEPDIILVDGDKTIPGIPTFQRPIIGGDAVSASIAAASVVAKVTRDRLMVEMSKHYPGYGFERHKGYGAPEHLEALRKLGPSPIHRMTFSVVRQSTYSEVYQSFAGLIVSACDCIALREIGFSIGRAKDGLAPYELDDLRQLYVKFEKKLKAQSKGEHEEKSLKMIG